MKLDAYARLAAYPEANLRYTELLDTRAHVCVPHASHLIIRRRARAGNRRLRTIVLQRPGLIRRTHYLDGNA